MTVYQAYMYYIDSFSPLPYVFVGSLFLDTRVGHRSPFGSKSSGIGNVGRRIDCSLHLSVINTEKSICGDSIVRCRNTIKVLGVTNGRLLRESLVLVERRRRRQHGERLKDEGQS